LIVPTNPEFVRRIVPVRNVSAGERTRISREFLEKIGWEDEKPASGKSNGAQKKPSTRVNLNFNEKKELEKAARREKARIEKLEAEIIKSESALKKFNEQLVLEANRNNLAQMRELSVKISQVKREIEDLYSQYAE